MWLCRIVVAKCSKPLVAGLRIITLPVSSSITSRWRSAANFLRYAAIFSSCLEGRGILLISANCSNTRAGLSSTLLIFYIFLLCFILFFYRFILPLPIFNCLKVHCKSNKNDQDNSIERVNNCYIRCVIMHKDYLSKRRKVYFSAYSRQCCIEKAGYSLCHWSRQRGKKA